MLVWSFFLGGGGWFVCFSGQSGAGNGRKLLFQYRVFITHKSSLLLSSEPNFDLFSINNVIYWAKWSHFLPNTGKWMVSFSSSRISTYVPSTGLEAPLPSLFSVFFPSASVCDIYKSIVTTGENVITPLNWTMWILDLQPFNLLSTEKPRFQCLLRADYPSGDKKEKASVFPLPSFLNVSMQAAYRRCYMTFFSCWRQKWGFFAATNWYNRHCLSHFSPQPTLTPLVSCGDLLLKSVFSIRREGGSTKQTPVTAFKV